MADKSAAKKKPRPVATTIQKSAATARASSGEKSAAAIGNELQKLDLEILKLINRRATLTQKLFDLDADKRSSRYDPGADDELFARLEPENAGPLPHRAVRSVFRNIMSAVRNQVRTQRVAFLGPAYSFTHMAAMERFGESAELIPVSTIASVFEEVNRGHADFGMVPIENSTDGRIIDTLEMFTRLPLRICGEVQMCIHHNLMGRTPRSEVTEVYSKTQALSQCRDWLSRNMPQARVIEVTSTSTAAQIARDKKGAAAVASRQAAVEYGLEIIAENIEDNKQNITRFAVIGDKPLAPTGRDRTSILLQIPHKSGALFDALGVFRPQKLNLTWIESFPLRGPETGYIFFLDCEGHSKEPKVKKALEELERMAVRMEVLGSYPRSEPME